MKFLITIENIKEFRPMSSSIPQDRIAPYIQEAQQFDLKRLLGDPFYADFMLRFDNNADSKYAAYQALLKGTTYTINGNNVEYPGLIGYLSYMTLARFFNNNQINVTKYGLVTKSMEQSEPLDWKAVAAAVAELRSNALNFQVDIRQFLMASVNAGVYPLFSFQDGSAMGQTGVKFFDPDDNFPLNTNGRTLISW